jgi:di/tricarboxylate transporter
MQISPSRLMMPLSFAGLISGMMTLVATPPNLVVNSELIREGLEGFSFFSVTPIGLVVLVMGIIYMLLTRFALKGEKQDKAKEGWKRRSFRDLIKEYGLDVPDVWLSARDRLWWGSGWMTLSYVNAMARTSSGLSAGVVFVG